MEITMNIRRTVRNAGLAALAALMLAFPAGLRSFGYGFKAGQGSSSGDKTKRAGQKDSRIKSEYIPISAKPPAPGTGQKPSRIRADYIPISSATASPSTVPSDGSYTLTVTLEGTAQEDQTIYFQPTMTPAAAGRPPRKVTFAAVRQDKIEKGKKSKKFPRTAPTVQQDTLMDIFVYQRMKNGNIQGKTAKLKVLKKK
jgi:hypothetical protein